MTYLAESSANLFDCPLGMLDAENQILNQAFERFRSQKLNGETNDKNKHNHI